MLSATTLGHIADFQGSLEHSTELWKAAAAAGDDVWKVHGDLRTLIERGHAKVHGGFDRSAEVADTAATFEKALVRSRRADEAVATAQRHVITSGSSQDSLIVGRISSLGPALQTASHRVSAPRNDSHPLAHSARQLFVKQHAAFVCGESMHFWTQTQVRRAWALQASGAAAGTTAGFLSVPALGFLEASPILAGALVAPTAMTIAGAALVHRRNSALDHDPIAVVHAFHTAAQLALEGETGSVLAKHSARQSVQLLKHTVASAHHNAEVHAAASDEIRGRLLRALDGEDAIGAREIGQSTDTDETTRLRHVDDWKRVLPG